MRCKTQPGFRCLQGQRSCVGGDSLYELAIDQRMPAIGNDEYDGVVCLGGRVISYSSPSFFGLASPGFDRDTKPFSPSPGIFQETMAVS